MTWTDNRKFRVKFLNPNNNNQAHTIEFEVAESGRVEFHKAVEYFLATCRTYDGLIKSCDTILGDKGEVLELEIKIVGFQDKMSSALNQHVGELSKHAVRAK